MTFLQNFDTEIVQITSLSRTLVSSPYFMLLYSFIQLIAESVLIRETLRMPRDCMMCQKYEILHLKSLAVVE